MSNRVITLNPKLFHCYQPIFQITRLIGLNPFTFKKSSSLYHLKWSWILFICSTITITTLLLFIIYGLLLFLENHTHGFHWTAESNYFPIIDFFDLQLAAFFFVVTQPFYFRNLATILTGFDRIDLLLSPLDSKSERKQTVIFSMCVVGVFLAGITIDEVLTWNKMELKSYLFYFFYVYVIGFEMKYWQLVFLVKTRMSTVNKVLGGDHDTNHIRKVIKAHEHIHDVVRTINKTFSLQISMVLLSCLIKLTGNCFMLFAAFRTKDSVFYIAMLVTWLGIHFGRLCLVVEVCHRCEMQNQKTFNLVISLLTTLKDKERKNELKNFALKLVDNKLQFSSFAVPRINRSLLSKMANAITTFLVILIQFSSL